MQQQDGLRGGKWGGRFFSDNPSQGQAHSLDLDQPRGRLPFSCSEPTPRPPARPKPGTGAKEGAGQLQQQSPPGRALAGNWQPWLAVPAPRWEVAAEPTEVTRLARLGIQERLCRVLPRTRLAPVAARAAAACCCCL